MGHRESFTISVPAERQLQPGRDDPRSTPLPQGPRGVHVRLPVRDGVEEELEQEAEEGRRVLVLAVVAGLSLGRKRLSEGADISAGTNAMNPFLSEPVGTDGHTVWPFTTMEISQIAKY